MDWEAESLDRRIKPDHVVVGGEGVWERLGSEAADVMSLARALHFPASAHPYAFPKFSMSDLYFPMLHHRRPPNRTNPLIMAHDQTLPSATSASLSTYFDTFTLNTLP